MRIVAALSLACLAPAAAASSGGFLQGFGTGCAPFYPGSTIWPIPKIRAKGATLAPGDAEFQVALSDFFGMPLLLIGASSAVSGNPALPYSLGSSGCQLLVSPDFRVIALPATSGEARLFMPIPRDPALAGSDVYFQWHVLGPMLDILGDPTRWNPIGMTQGLRLRIGS